MYITLKRSIQEEDITILTAYTPNIGSPKYLKQILKGEMKSNTIMFWDFNALLTSIDRSSK